MSKLTRDDVLKLAALSRLKLTESEIVKFSVELSEILNYVEVLDKADTRGFKPTYQVTGLKNVMRKDEIIQYHAKPEELLKIAPDSLDGQYKVKRVL